MMRMDVKVIPSAGKDEVSEDGKRMTVKVKAPAKGNKANVAVVKLMEKHFGKEVKIVSGLKSRNKIIAIDEEEDE